MRELQKPRILKEHNPQHLSRQNLFFKGNIFFSFVKNVKLKKEKLSIFFLFDFSSQSEAKPKEAD